MIVLTNPLLTYSERKKEIAIEKGKHIIKARKEVNKVPIIKGIAENKLLFGSHVVFVKKSKKLFFIAGKDSLKRLNIIKINKKRNKITENIKNDLKILSFILNFPDFNLIKFIIFILRNC